MENQSPPDIPLSVGMLLTTSPEHQNSHTVYRLAQSLLAAGHRVELFLMDDGIYNLVPTDAPESPSSRLRALQSKGLSLSLCTQSAETRGIFEEDCPAGIGWRSQHELALIVERSDRFLSFGG